MDSFSLTVYACFNRETNNIIGNNHLNEMILGFSFFFFFLEGGCPKTIRSYSMYNDLNICRKCLLGGTTLGSARLSMFWFYKPTETWYSFLLQRKQVGEQWPRRKRAKIHLPHCSMAFIPNWTAESLGILIVPQTTFVQIILHSRKYSI